MTPKDAEPRAWLVRRPRFLRRGRRLVLWLSAFCLLTLAFVVFVPLLGSYLIRHMVLPRVEQRAGLRITVQDIILRPKTVRLVGVRLHVPSSNSAGTSVGHGPAGVSVPVPEKAQNAEPVTIAEVQVEYTPWPLFLGRVEVHRVVALRPVLKFVRGGDDDNVTQLLSRLRKSGPSGLSDPNAQARLRGPEQVLVRDGELSIRDDLGAFRVGSLQADLLRKGSNHVVLTDATFAPTSGTVAKAKKFEVFWQSPARFLPDGLPDVHIEGAEFAPWPRLSLSGVSGTIKPDLKEPRKAVIALFGGYGGVEQKLWEANGWVLTGADWKNDAQGELHLHAQRFRLSQLEPILKDTPVIDADRTEVDARMDLSFAANVLSAKGEFRMAHLSLFAPRLVAEPVRDFSFSAQANGHVDLKARKIKLDGLKVNWDGVEVNLDGEAEAQPRERRPSVLQAETNGAKPGGAVAESWREKWRTVSLHFAMPPMSCQSLLQALPPAVVPRIREFQLDGTFSTDIRLFVDFAKLLKLPPPKDPDGLDEETPSPAVVLSKKAQVSVGKARSLPAGVLAANGKDPKDDPVQISGQVGIDGCRVKEAPKDLNVAKLLGSFTHTVQVEPGKELSFVIGPENPDFVPFDQLSPYLINSIMTTEDHAFLRHRGFIVPEFRSALQSNLERGYFRLGASSITMQMVKNVLLSREKTLSRKLQELFLTWYIENYLTDDPVMIKALSKGMTAQQYFAKLAKEKPAPPKPPDKETENWPPSRWAAEQSFAAIRDATPIKRRILEIYFNAIEFGPYMFGIGRAARHYFGKEAKDLTPREAAFFSSILPNPKRRYIQYCKGAADDGWEKYVERIVRRVHSRGRMTDEDLQGALANKLAFDRHEALPEKECFLLVQYFSELPPPGAPPPPPPPPGTPAKAVPSLPPWVEMHHGKLRYVTPKETDQEGNPPSPSNHQPTQATEKTAVPF